MKNILKMTPIALLIFLFGCVGLTPQGSTIRVVSQTEAVKECALIGSVESSSSWGGFAATGAGFDNAMNELKNNTARLGGNVVLTTVVSNTMGGTRMMGEAYNCQRPK